MEVVRGAHLVEPDRNKAGQDLAVAENQDAGDVWVGGKYLAVVFPLQLGAEYHVGAILQVGQPAPESIQHCPGERKEQNRPAKSVASLRQGLLLSGFGVGGG